MAKHKILYICQQIMPYLPENEESKLCRELSQAMQERGNEIRTFMPRYGCVNERRNQLHEVIRLSGMNLIIDDNDHQLIIKVASIPSARIQIYFIDNEDFFSRRAVVRDENGEEFADNDERMVFFARGVLETVKKLRWTPDVVHCHGWFSSIVPLYLRKVFNNDPILRDVKIVSSRYEDRFTTPLNADLGKKLAGEGMDDENISIIDTPSYENLYSFVMSQIDGVIAGSASVDSSLLEQAKAAGKKVMEYVEPESEEFYENYTKFYDELFEN
jgi:starch synthase